MPRMEPLCHLIGINSHKLTKEEYLILEAELYSQLCEEIKERYRQKHKTYFNLMKLNKEKENAMIEANFINHVITDILSTDEYSLKGIAHYTQTPEDVLTDILIGKNKSPSLFVFQKIIDLHRSIRAEFYRETLKKIIEKYLAKEE